jgi:serine/threonine-protein phosphatase PGAM5
MAEDLPICRRVLLMRHGHYERTGDLGDEVWGLSALGRRQAVKLGKRLEKIREAASGRFEGVYVSPWPRATQTAEIAAREMDMDAVRIKPYLHESIPLVDSRWIDLEAVHPRLQPTTEQDRDAVQIQLDRVRDRFFKPPKRRSTVFVFTHGNLIRYLVAHTVGLPPEAWATMDICHASITEIRVYPGEFEALIHYNETGHFPPSMITTV